MVSKTNGGFLISQIKQVSGRRFEKLLADAGVDAFNGAQGRILYVLWQEDNVPIATLSKQTGLAKTTLTGMLDRMEQGGLINRRFDPADRRQVRIALTTRARALQSEYDAVSAAMSEIFYAGFTDAEILVFETTLRRILHNVSETESQLSVSDQEEL
ncbi:MAG TPA: MarR family transcriptional regulator [Candidatus Limiplasma sp.]|nr:MarR family transcriptional regulator [Candidatus Limiplasma sp.]